MKLISTWFELMLQELLWYALQFHWNLPEILWHHLICNDICGKSAWQIWLQLMVINRLDSAFEVCFGTRSLTWNTFRILKPWSLVNSLLSFSGGEAWFGFYFEVSCNLLHFSSGMGNNRGISSIAQWNISQYDSSKFESLSTDESVSCCCPYLNYLYFISLIFFIGLQIE